MASQPWSAGCGQLVLAIKKLDLAYHIGVSGSQGRSWTWFQSGLPGGRGALPQEILEFQVAQQPKN